MKIGFDAKRVFSNSTGLGNFSRGTISGLSRHFPETKLYLFHPGKKRISFKTPENAVEVAPKRIWWKSVRKVWRSFRIAHLVKKLQLDLYHGLSHELPVGIEKTGVKSIVTIHDLIFLRFPKFHSKIDREIYRQKIRHSCIAATRVHAISEQTKHDLMTFFSVPEEKITIIYQSINPVFFERVDNARKQELRKKYQLPKKFILSVGTVEARKNLLGLLEGMVLSKTYVPLVVVGKLTDYQHKVQKFIEADLNRLQVYFLSQIKDDELTVLYQMAEMVVYPSLFEGFGLPVPEAQASGCPVITSNISSLPEAGGEGALYIDPQNPQEIGDAVKNLLVNQTLRNDLIAKGKVNAQRFTTEKFIKQLNQLYISVLND